MQTEQARQIAEAQREVESRAKQLEYSLSTKEGEIKKVQQLNESLQGDLKRT